MQVKVLQSTDASYKEENACLVVPVFEQGLP